MGMVSAQEGDKERLEEEVPLKEEFWSHELGNHKKTIGKWLFNRISWDLMGFTLWLFNSSPWYRWPIYRFSHEKHHL